MRLRMFVVAGLLAAPVPGQAQRVQGMWSGTYRCAQGLTAFTLDVVDHKDGTIAAVFQFGPTPNNPNLPNGCFEMTADLGSGGHVAFHATHWRVRPFGYVTVDLAGTLAADGRTMTGTVDGPFCSTFELTRGAPTTPLSPCGGVES